MNRNLFTPPDYAPKIGSYWINIPSGNVYEVIAIARNSDKWGYSVIYKRVGYKDPPQIYSIELHNWFGEVLDSDGRPVKKFQPDPGL